MIIGSISFQETTHKQTTLLDMLCNNNINLSPTNYFFHHRSIDYLVFNMSMEEILPIQTNILNIIPYPPLKSKRQLKLLLDALSLS